MGSDIVDCGSVTDSVRGKLRFRERLDLIYTLMDKKVMSAGFVKAGLFPPS